MEPGSATGSAEGAALAGPAAQEWAVLDRAYAAYLDEHPEPPGGSLLAQTILTGRARRSLLPLIEVRPGSDVLDLGTGFGPVPFEIAHLHPVNAVGLDQDEQVLGVASGIAATLDGWLQPGSTARFQAGDVADLPFAPGSFDLATARLLFQHLPAPRKVVEELWRVVRPGGSVFVFDVDDGFSVTYPPASPALEALERAFAECQSCRGGDREVGRKLSTYFVDAGFRVRSMQLLAQVQHLASEQGDASRLVTSARLRNVRDEIVRRGLLASDEFDRNLASYEGEPPVPRFRAECQLALVAERP